MWVMKWVLASAVLHENVMQYVSGHVSERIGNTEEFTLPEYMRNAVVRNISCLFPAEYGPAGKVILLVLLFVLIAVAVVFSRKKIDFRRIALYAAIGLLPYLRYITLRNHSYLHYFFTYRAQAATVLAFFMILSEIVQLPGTFHADHAAKSSPENAAKKPAASKNPEGQTKTGNRKQNASGAKSKPHGKQHSRKKGKSRK